MARAARVTFTAASPDVHIGRFGARYLSSPPPQQMTSASSKLYSALGVYTTIAAMLPIPAVAASEVALSRYDVLRDPDFAVPLVAYLVWLTVVLYRVYRREPRLLKRRPMTTHAEQSRSEGAIASDLSAPLQPGWRHRVQRSRRLRTRSHRARA
jgi:hypothetical protein